MNEIIRAIEPYDTPQGWVSGLSGSWSSSMSGYLVTTDQQMIRLLIDNGQSCCESWGYFLSEDDLSQFIGATLTDIRIADTALNQKKYESNIGEYGLDVGGCMFVDLVTDRGVLQFTAYNGHNGYYGHSALVLSNQLKSKESL